MILILGVLANLFFIAGGLFRQPRHSMTLVIFGNLTFAVYYFSMELYSPIFSVATGALACFLIINTQCPKRIRLISVLCSGGICTLLILNYSSPYDLFLMAAAVAIAFAQMNKNNYIRYKFFVLLSQALWITFCLHFSDYAMLCTCAFCMTTNIYALLVNMHKDGTLQALLERRKFAFARIPVKRQIS